MRTSPASSSSRRGFTLVEMMVSLSVLALLCTMYGSFFNNASSAWTSGEDRTERRRNARALTDYIGQELRGALIPVEKFSVGSGSNLQFLINPPSSQVPTDCRHADCIFFQAPLATELTYGEVAEVGYFVKWVADIKNHQQPVLCRYFVNPSVQAGGAWKPNDNFRIFDADQKDSWLTPGLLTALAPGSPSSQYRGMFAEGVVGLWIRSFGLDGKELPRDFDSRVGYDCDFSAVDSSGASKSWQEKRYLPARVQVSIAQIDSRHASRLDPLAGTIQRMSKASDVRDAREFMDSLVQQSSGDKSLIPILQGTRAYSTEVQLANAR